MQLCCVHVLPVSAYPYDAIPGHPGMTRYTPKVMYTKNFRFSVRLYPVLQVLTGGQRRKGQLQDESQVKYLRSLSNENIL